MKGSASPWPGVKCLGRILAAPDRKLAQAPKVPRERTRWLHRDSSARSTPADTEELSLAEPGHRIQILQADILCTRHDEYINVRNCIEVS